MTFQIEIPDQTLQDICEQAVNNAMNETKYHNDFGTRLRGLIEISMKQAINKQFANYEAIISAKVAEKIDAVISEEVTQKLKYRAGKEIAKQLKNPDLFREG